MRNTPIILSTVVIILLSFFAFSFHSITGFTLRDMGYSVFQPQTDTDLLSREGPALFVTGALKRGEKSSVYVVPGPRGFDRSLTLTPFGKTRPIQRFSLCATSVCYTKRSISILISRAIPPGPYTITVHDLTTQTPFTTTVQIK